MASTPPPPTDDHLRLLLDQVDGRMGYQRDEWDGLDRKATTVLAATAVLLGLVVNNSNTFGAYPAPAPAVFLGALLVLVVGLLAGVVTLWPRVFKVVPEPEPFFARYARKASDDTLLALLATKAEAFKINRLAARWKLQAVRVQMAILVTAGVLLFVVLLIGRLETHERDRSGAGAGHGCPSHTVARPDAGGTRAAPDHGCRTRPARP